MRSRRTVYRTILVLSLSLLLWTAAFHYAMTAIAAGPWYVAPGGDDGNNCLDPSTPCATINGAIDKAASGDTIYVASGTYYGSGNEVVRLDKRLNLSGGWDPGFVRQIGLATVDGQGQRRGVVIADVTALIERFRVTAGYSGPNAGAGGISIWGTSVYTVTLQECEVSSNHAAYGGGGIMVSFWTGILRLKNSSVIGNSADEDGGGIYSLAPLFVINSTISGNRAGKSPWSGLGRGGGIFATNHVYLYNASVTQNWTVAYAAGGVDTTQTGQPLEAQNSIIAGNTAAGAPSDYRGLVISHGYDLFGSTDPYSTYEPGPGDVVNADAVLGPLQGSPGYQPLLLGSPAIDGGNPAGCMDDDSQPILGDQRGFPRFQTCDIGAYELQPIGFSTKTSSVHSVAPGQSLTYTIALRNDDVVDIPGVRVTDTLPISLTYLVGSLVATSGAAEYADGMITWAGTVSAGLGATVTFGADVGSECGPIENQAIISGGGEIYTRTAAIQVVYRRFLPVIIRTQ